MAASSGGNLYFNITISPWVCKADYNGSSTEIADTFHRELHSLRFEVEKTLQQNFPYFRISTVYPSQCTTDVKIMCAVVKKVEDCEHFLTHFSSGRFKEEFEIACEAFGFFFKFGLDPTKNEHLKLDMHLDETEMSKLKIVTKKESQRKPQQERDVGMQSSSTDEMLVQKHILVSIPPSSTKQVLSVKFVCPDIKELDGQYLQSKGLETNVWELHANVPNEISNFRYRYKQEIFKQKDFPLMGSFLPWTTEVKETKDYDSGDFPYILDVVADEKNYFSGYLKICSYLINDATINNVKERIMMLEHFQKENVIHSLGKLASATEQVLKSSNVLTTTEQCLAFTCFIGNIFKDLSKLRSENFIGSDTSYRVLTLCCKGDMNQLPTSCQGLVLKVLDELCKIRFGNRYSILTFMYMTYPFLPLESFPLKEFQRQKANLKSSDENMTMVRSITRVLCNKMEEHPPAKNECQYLDQMRRHLPLELQIIIVDYLVERRVDKKIVESSIEGLSGMYTVHLKIASKEGRMADVIAYCESLRKKSYFDDDVIISQFEPNFLYCLGNFDLKLTDESMKSVHKVCKSEHFFKSIEMKEKLLTVIVTSKNKNLHDLFTQILQTGKFDDLQTDSQEHLAYWWFDTAVEHHCSRNKKDNTEFVKTVYSYLGNLLSVPVFAETPDIRKKMSEKAYSTLHSIDLLDMINSIPKIEDLQCDFIEDIFKLHVQSCLKKSFATAGLMNLQELVTKISGKNLQKVRINSQPSLATWTSLIENTGLKDSFKNEEAFPIVLDTRVLWIAIANADGKRKQEIWKHPLFVHASKVIRSTKDCILQKKITSAFFQRFRNRFEECCEVWNAFHEPLKFLSSTWKRLEQCIEARRQETKNLSSLIHTIKGKVGDQEMKDALSHCKMLIDDHYEEIENGDVQILDIEKATFINKTLQSIFLESKYVFTLEKSYVFWNLIIDHIQAFDKTETEDVNETADEEMYKSRLSDTAETLIEKSSLDASRFLTFVHKIITYIGKEGCQLYRSFWLPLLQGKDKSLVKVAEIFRGSDLQVEIDTATEFCFCKMDLQMEIALRKFFEFDDSKKNLDILEKALGAFRIECNEDILFRDAKSAYHKLRSRTLEELTLLNIREPLTMVEKVSTLMSDKVTGILYQVGYASQLIEFLRSVADDDLRNLIDAVEEHSEQSVRESTVSDLISMKRFFQPLLRKDFSSDVSNFLLTVRRSVENSGVRKVSEKIDECVRHLHGLKALYKHVANRGERTKEMVENIVSRGKFRFTLKDRFCDVNVEYKQDKKMYSHGLVTLNDLRSRALLLMNSEDRKTPTEKVASTSTKDALEKFVEIVDMTLEIASAVVKLKMSGHFKYSKYDSKCSVGEKLTQTRNELVRDYQEWQQLLESSREEFYLMNFLYGDQLQVIYEYMINGRNESMVRHILKFVHPEVTDLHIIRKYISDVDGHMQNPKGILSIIGKSIHLLCEDLPTKEREFLIKSELKIPSDVAQPGRPNLVSLDSQSRLVVGTLLALYLNTTGNLPKAHQILFCDSSTSLEEVLLIIRRCIGDHNGNLYCIANVEKLHDDQQFQLASEILRLPKGNYRFALICKGGESHPFVDRFSDFVMHPKALTYNQLQECFKHMWPNVCTITSDVPGLGKSDLIYAMSRQRGMGTATLHVSGPILKKGIVEKLLSIRIKSFDILHIDIGVVNDPYELDEILFELITTGYLSSGTASFFLPTSYMYIEIGNSISNILRNSMTNIICFDRKHLEWDDYKSMKISKEICSPVQVVCSYLKSFSEKTIDTKDIYFNGPQQTKVLQQDECRSLLKLHFSTSADLSYSIVNTFLGVLSDQLKKLSTSLFFRTQNLQDLKVKSELMQALLTMSKDFSSRSILSCRSTQTAALVSDDITKDKNMISPTEELAKRVEGMIRWEDSNHLMVLFHEDMNTVSALYRNKSAVPLQIKRLFESQLNRTLEEFSTKPQDDLISILIKLTRPLHKQKLDPTSLTKDYALTPDNLLKMVLMHLRIKAHVPVVIMGETGCGKTSLVRYLASACGAEFEVLSIHAGVREDVILKKIKECDKRARKCASDIFWLFLDEINTCDHLGLLADIICHKKCLGESLAANIVFIGACNPYRLRSIKSIHTAGLQSKIKTDELSRLVYRVHPLPEMMVDYVFDFGSLSDRDEEKYVERMVHDVINEKEWKHLIVVLITTSQRFVRKEEQACSVSLRDVERCKKLITWFMQIFRKKNPVSSRSFVDIKVRSTVMALAVCYQSRFVDGKRRKEYREVVAAVFKSHTYIRANVSSEDCIKDIIEKEQDDIIDRMELPEGIARNTALRENVFVILVCILNKIPIFVVGKPGCSKSLSMQLIRSNLRGKDSKDGFFKTLPQLYCVSFQGSESSTSEGIIKVFDKAKKYQEHNSDEDVMSVVILDEIGLAEISRFNPLKVLHSLLEPENKRSPDVAVVGISNWALDAAKMNRAIHLSRPEMDSKELYETSRSISLSLKKQSCADRGTTTFLDQEQKLDICSLSLADEKILRGLAEGFFQYSKEQTFKNFHGLRDFYSLTKFISKGLLESGTDTEEKKVCEIVLRGIRRNLGGLPTELIKAEKTFMDKMNIKGIESTPVLDLIKDSLADKFARHLMLITSGNAVIGVLEKMLKEMEKHFIVILGSQFEDDQTDEYHYRILSRIILCMEQGFCLILKDLENIYGSLYDMLNQNYTTVGQKRNCRVALGPYSNPMCHVHSSFKCIVVVEEAKLDFTDPPFLNRFEKQCFRYVDMLDDNCAEIIEKLNTYVDDSCLSKKQFQPSDTYPLYTEDLIPSLVIAEKMNPEPVENIYTDCCSKLLWISTPDAILRMPFTFAWDQNEMYVRKLQKEYFSLPIHNGLEDLLTYVTERENKIFSVPKSLKAEGFEDFDTKDIPPDHEFVSDNSENRQEGFSSTCNSTMKVCSDFTHTKGINNCVSLVAVLTHSNIHTSINQLCPTFEMQNEKLSSFRSEKTLYSKVRDFFDSPKTLLTLQCSFVRDSHHTLMAKTMIEEQKHDYEADTGNCFKLVCMIFHLEHDDSETIAVPQMDFLSGWRICMLDTIQKPLKDIPSMQEQTVYDILSERKPLHFHICENLFWAFSRIQYSGSGHSIERILKLIENIKTSDRMLKAVEDFILEWILRKPTTEKKTNWILDIACDKRKLHNGGSFNRTVETYLADMIKVPLATIIYRLEEANAFECVFVDDERSAERFDSWSKLLKNRDFVNIDETNEPSGPECYTCESPLLTAKMPFSYSIIQLLEKHKEEYLDAVSRLKIACEIEDEELPKSIFIDLLTKYKDIIHIDMAEINNYAYSNWEEDYTSDFWEYISMNHCKSITSDDKIQILKWTSTFFIEFNDEELIEKMAKLHLVNWTYGSTLLNILMLFELLQLFKQITATEFIDMVQTVNLQKCSSSGEMEGDSLQSEDGQSVIEQTHEMHKERIVESICSILLPQKSTMIELKSVQQWKTTTNSILPYLGSVSLNTNGIHCLRFCSDLATNLFVPFDIQEKSFAAIGDLLAAKDGILDGPEVRETVFNFLYQLCDERPDIKVQIQKVLVIFVHRCLAANENSNILHYVIECMGNDRFIDFDCSFMGPIFSYAFDIEESVDEDLFLTLLERSSENNELNPLLQSIDTTLKILFGKGFPDPPLAGLLVEVIQKKFQCTINESNVSNFDSTSNTHVHLLTYAVDVIKSSSETSILLVVAIAYIRQVIISTVHLLKNEGFNASNNPLLTQQMDGIFTQNNDADELNKHRTQCLVLYFLRSIREMEGTICCQKQCTTLMKVMPSLKEYVLCNEELLEVPYLKPLRFYAAEHRAVEQAFSAIEEKKTEQLQQFLLEARQDKKKLLCLFSVFAEKIFFRNVVEGLTDTGKDVAKRALSIVSSVDIASTHLNVMRFLALEADFSHKMFVVDTESDTRVVHKVSVLINLMCSILTYGQSGNIWFDLLSKEKAATDCKLPGMEYTEKDQPCNGSPFLCLCGYRFISNNGRCPQCGSNQDSVSLGKMLPSAPIQMSSGFSNKLHFQIGHFFTVGVQICSYAIGVCKGPNSTYFGTQCNADVDIHDYLQGEIFATWSQLEESLQMSSEDLSSFLRLTILRLKKVLYNGEALFCCKYASDEVHMVERAMDKVFEELIPNRFKQITLYHQEFFQTIKENHRGLLTQLDESLVIDSIEGKQLLPSLFKVNGVVSFQGLLTEVQMCKTDRSFLAMMLHDLELLNLPQYILPLLRWHQVSIAIGSFKIRRVECPEITVRNFISMERVDSRRRLLKESFENFKAAWQKLRKCIELIPDEFKSNLHVGELSVISNNSKLETCLMINENSPFELMLRFLVQVQNEFLDRCLSLSCNGCVSLQFLQSPSGDCSSTVRSVPLKEAKSTDIIEFEWDDEILNYSQCNTNMGEGKRVAYDMEKIEREVAFSIVQGKRYLDCTLDIGKITFIDELFQNSAQLLHDIQQIIPQEPLKSEIIKAIITKKEGDNTFTEALLTQVGMALSIMKKAGGDAEETLVEYLERWKDIISPKSYIDLLPEPRSSLKVCHVVALFQYLEELSGDSILESLDDCYRCEVPIDGKITLENTGNKYLKHLGKLGQSLKIFLHRSITFSEKAIKVDQPLRDYLIDPKLWPHGSFMEENIAAEERGKLVQVPLSDVVHITILVEHIYGTISYIQEFIEVQKQQDQRISSVIVSYQSTYKEQKQTKKNKVAKKKFGKT